MNKFDITELPKQWLVALVALAFTGMRLFHH